MQFSIHDAFERGARLASGEPASCVGAARPSIREDQTTEDAIRAILADCMRHFAGNWPLAGTNEAEEAVHQMRVALRRLRAALAFFGREFPCPEFAAFRAEAKAIATTLGQARDWDVFIALVESGPLAHFGEEIDFAPLIAAARSKAAAGHRSRRNA